MIRTLIACAALFAFVPHAGAQVAVKGEWISLGDVAPVTGEAADILISPAPPPGQKLALDPVFLTSVAKRSGVIIALPLDQPIWVTRSSGTAPAPKQANPARPANPAPQIGGQTATSAEILVLVRDVARGQRISEADVDWADPSALRNVRNGLTDIDLALGMETKRGLKSGQPLQMMDLKTPALVRKGEAVKLVYTSPGLRLTVEGTAQADAGKGESVRVLNTFSKRTVEAVAIADGEARVGKR